MNSVVICPVRDGIFSGSTEKKTVPFYWTLWVQFKLSQKEIPIGI